MFIYHIRRKHVLRGGLDADVCSSKRYQPWPITFYTNVSTNCIFLKSSCNEEGQLVYGDGNRNRDTTCRCDYTSGYDFLVKPQHLCFCIPSEEDCSCYLKTCTDPSVNLDDECNYSRINNLTNQCRPIVNGRATMDENRSQTQYLPRKDNFSTPVLWKRFAGITTFIVCIDCSMLYIRNLYWRKRSCNIVTVNWVREVCKNVSDDQFCEFQTSFIQLQNRWKQQKKQQTSPVITSTSFTASGPSGIRSSCFQPMPSLWKMPPPHLQEVSPWQGQSPKYMQSYMQQTCLNPTTSLNDSETP